MINKIKSISLFLIGVFTTSFLVAQPSLVISSMAASNDSNSPKTSDYNETYDLGGGNSMDILTDDANNNTLTTLNNGADTYPIDTTFTEGPNGESTIIINDTYEITADNSNKTELKDKNTGFNVTIDNGFNPHAVDSIQAIDYHHDAVSDISASSQKSDLDDYTQHFDINENGDIPWYVTFDWDIAADTEILDVNNTVVILTSFYWVAIIYGLTGYNFSLFTGDIETSTDGGATWFPTTMNFYGQNELRDDPGLGVSFEYVNGTIIIAGWDWEIIVFTYLSVWQISIFSLLFYDFFIIWYLYSTITIYWGVFVYIFYLWIYYGLLYVFIYPDYDWKIEYYYTYIVIVWVSIEISIWFVDIYIHWVILFYWEWWIVKIQWYYYFIDIWIFIDFIVWIEYYYFTYNWIYIYYVPTPILPNLLYIDILYEGFTNTTFDITIEVKDLWGNPVSGATITGTWDTSSIGTVTDNGDGTYDFALTAILVNPGQPGKWLNLTASKLGYADGTHETEIAVVEPPEPPNILRIDLIDTVFTNTTFDFTVKVTDNDENPISGVTITGTWDTSSIGTVTDNGDGTYDFMLTAILVNPGQPGKWLNLTASKLGYADGTHKTEIAVDPEAVNKFTPAVDGNGGAAIPGPSIFLIGVVSAVAIVFVAKYLTKKRKFITN